jgi:RNA polymerase sigma-70 factor (ECF subfamily)
MLRNIAGSTNQVLPRHVIKRRSDFVSCDRSDRDLIERIAAGDKTAMQVLFARYNVDVYRFVRRLVDEESLAEDFVSEVFFEVWRQPRTTFEGHSHVSTWLLCIAHNKVLTVLEHESMELLDDNPGGSTADAAALQKQRSTLLECLLRLPRAHREIIDLIYYHQKTIDEIAEIIHVPPRTAKARMFYARRQLAKSLDTEEVTTAPAG